MGESDTTDGMAEGSTDDVVAGIAEPQADGTIDSRLTGLIRPGSFQKGTVLVFFYV